MALKIACGQIEIIAGRPDLNTKKILRHMDMACQNGIDILLLPELAVPGYFLGDLWEQTAFIEDCASYGDEIIAATENCGELCVIFGNIAVDNSKRNEDGRARKYNAAFAAQHGKLLTNGTLPYDFIVKNALPNYREFDDNRHFYGLRQLALELDKQVAGLPAAHCHRPRRNRQTGPDAMRRRLDRKLLFRCASAAGAAWRRTFMQHLLLPLQHQQKQQTAPAFRQCRAKSRHPAHLLQ